MSERGRWVPSFPMPTASVQPDLSDLRVRRRLPLDPRVIITVVVGLIVVAVLAPALRSGPFVDKVAFANPSDYAYEVAVSSSSGGSTTLLGNIAAQDTTTIGTVFDEGSQWTFRFSTQDRVVGDVVMSRDDLIGSGWRVAVPARFAQKLATEGVIPTD